MNLEEVLEKIPAIREELRNKSRWQDINWLLEQMLALTTYNSYLSEYIATLHRNASEKAYTQFKQAVKSGATVTGAEQESKGKSLDEREAYENVLNIRKSTTDLIIGLRLFIRTKSDEKREQENG